MSEIGKLRMYFVKMNEAMEIMDKNRASYTPYEVQDKLREIKAAACDDKELGADAYHCLCDLFTANVLFAYNTNGWKEE